MTELLLRRRAPDQECLHVLIPLVEGELRRIARRYMRMERRGRTLETTALAARLTRLDEGADAG